MTDHLPASRVRESDDWIERVRAASDIVDVIGQTVALKRVGRNWVGLCPFHSEKTPSFSVHPERQFYHCFSCKAGGDVFRYVQESEHVGFVEAAEMLSRRAGIPVPERRGVPSGRRTALEALEAAATAFEQWLADATIGATARRHLEERGIEPATIRAFRLGAAPDAWEALANRLRDRFGEGVLVEAGLVARRDGGRGGVYDRFRGRLIVPLIASGGAVLGFGARALAADQQPKYLNSPESPTYQKRSFLFGLEQARKATGRDGEMIVVEGYFDAIAMAQAGIAHVVATSGTALTPEHAKQLQRIVATVVLTYDGDTAGQDAMLRSLGTLLAAGLEIRVAELPAGQDPDALVRSGGTAAWAAVRAAALDPIEYVQKHGLRRGGPGDPRERALQTLVDLANQIGDPVRQRLFLERGSEVFGMSERVMARAAQLKRAGQRSEAPIQAAVRAQTQQAGYAERELLQGLLHAPEHLEWVRAHLTVEDFQDPAARALAEALWAGGTASGTTSHPASGTTSDPASGTTSDSANEPAAALERELLSQATESLDWAAMIDGGVRRLTGRRRQRERRELQQELARLQRERPDDVERHNQLFRKIQDLLDLDLAEARGPEVHP